MLARQQEEDQEACAGDEQGVEDAERRQQQAQPLRQEKNVLLWLRRRELPHQARNARAATRLARAQVRGAVPPWRPWSAQAPAPLKRTYLIKMCVGVTRQR